jgi:hypothetical protein
MSEIERKFEDELKEASRSLSSPAGSCLPEDRLLAFYGDRVEEGEAEEIRGHLAACPSCVATAREARAFSETMSGWAGRREARPVRPRAAWWLAAAAVILAAGLIAYRLATSPVVPEASRRSDVIVAKAPYPLDTGSKEPILWRGGSSDETGAPRDFGPGMEAYAGGRLEDAARRLASALETTPAHEPSRFYLGVTLLLLERPGEAIDPLQRVAADGTPLLRQEARWYLALASLKAGHTVRAAEILSAIASNPEGPHGAEAAALLKRLHP